MPPLPFIETLLYSLNILPTFSPILEQRLQIGAYTQGQTKTNQNGAE